MGKRILPQRKGRGSPQFRVPSKGKIASAKYPAFPLNETHKGVVEDIVHERGRMAPLARVRFDNGTIAYLPAVEGLKVNDTLYIGPDAPLEPGNVLPLARIPEGTVICNIEKNYGDGGELVRAAGTSAILFSQTEDRSIVRLPSGASVELNPKVRATIGIVAGGGRMEKPFLKAGAKLRYMRVRGKKYPTVRGVAMASVYHPFGGGRHQHPGKPTSTSRNAPPGRKVGHIASKKTGRGRVVRRRGYR